MFDLTVSLAVHDYGDPKRSREFLRRALESVLYHQPCDEVILLTDTSWDVTEVTKDFPLLKFRILRQRRVTLSEAKKRRYLKKLKPEWVVEYWGHTRDLVIRTITEAKTTWVRTLDPDDEIACNALPFVQQVGDNVGMITGKVEVHHYKRGTRTEGPYFLGLGSSNVFRRKAVKEAAPYWDPGPWPDFTLVTIMLQLGWRVKQVDELFSITNVGPWSTRFRHKRVAPPWVQVETEVKRYMKWVLKNKKVG